MKRRVCVKYNLRMLFIMIIVMMKKKVRASECNEGATRSNGW